MRKTRRGISARGWFYRQSFHGPNLHERAQAYRQTVTVECVTCKSRRDIGPGEVEPNDVPSCLKCYSPMVAVSAQGRL